MTGVLKFGMWKTPLSPLIVWFMVEKKNALSSVSQSLENEIKQKLWLGINLAFCIETLQYYKMSNLFYMPTQSRTCI